jgi:lambda family phage portal protein
MFAWLSSLVLGAGRRLGHIPPSSRRPDQARRRTEDVRARYDSAQTTDENRRHWANADGYSPVTANSLPVRQTLRSRARYEVANNSYAKGIVLTLANDLVGTGPRLQLLTQDGDLNQRTEDAFETWAHRVRLAEKLRTMRMARATDGEAFAVLINNPAILGEVKLDLQLIEADYLDLPEWDTQEGIVYDENLNPVTYRFLDYHPGDGFSLSNAGGNRLRSVPAAQVLHWYRSDRPGQLRGVPDITPALPLFAQLRRYTLAVIAAAETAADFAAVLESTAPADAESDPIEPFDSIEIERRMMTTLPEGTKLNQLRAEQPTTTYRDFKHEILNEIARCLNMPFNVAAGNSSGYNYASGRLDHQTYYKAIRVERSEAEAALLDRILSAWLAEAETVGLVPRGQVWPHQWFWDGHEHVDPAKEANAQATRLASHTTTLAHEYASRGLDWEVQLRQRAKEVALLAELGLSPSAVQPTATITVDEEVSEDEE